MLISVIMDLTIYMMVCTCYFCFYYPTLQDMAWRGAVEEKTEDLADDGEYVKNHSECFMRNGMIYARWTLSDEAAIDTGVNAYWEIPTHRGPLEVKTRRFGTDIQYLVENASVPIQCDVILLHLHRCVSACKRSVFSCVPKLRYTGWLFSRPEYTWADSWRAFYENRLWLCAWLEAIIAVRYLGWLIPLLWILKELRLGNNPPFHIEWWRRYC
ncbi:membrane protein A34 [Aotine betaherpesvirus 1]|uniref:Membrane protein A34 n=1 Tax=Aotine betaherpesvirus 1 TaxID=50290 RepID=G8XUL2_9BETA|nr:membrane protein A34 [Aotine betaherpesvirus 1]AEV80854.1 membrane protein A34 [Aotine betaherpesvirus 1]